MPAPVRVVVIYGGRNTEHEVSCRSAAAVLDHLDRTRYEAVPILITEDGEWVVGAGAPSGDGMVRSMARAVDALREADVALPCLHGRYGEDGTVQSVLELAGVPYVGSGVLASAASMDKDFTKKLLAAEGIPVADGVVLGATGDLTANQRRLFGLPVFVKPARGGSSIGVSRVDDWSALPAALAAARLCDPKVLVEAAVPGREVDVGVLEMPDGQLLVSPPLEIRVKPGHGFFDYDAKYGAGVSEFVIPAELDDRATALLSAQAIQVFQALGCSGLLRIDFFLRADGSLVVNEVNTMPGLTEHSQFPRMWQAAGTSYPALLDLLLTTARAGGRARALTA